jgi:hypothetical protein
MIELDASWPWHLLQISYVVNSFADLFYLDMQYLITTSVMFATEPFNLDSSVTLMAKNRIRRLVIRRYRLSFSNNLTSLCVDGLGPCILICSAKASLVFTRSISRCNLNIDDDIFGSRFSRSRKIDAKCFPKSCRFPDGDKAFWHEFVSYLPSFLQSSGTHDGRRLFSFLKLQLILACFDRNLHRIRLWCNSTISRRTSTRSEGEGS